MSLTYDQKQQYVNAIDAIWQGSMRNNTVGNIDENVVRLMDTVMSEIRDKTRLFLAADMTFGIFYFPSGSWAEFLLMLAQNTVSGSFKGWIDVIRGNGQYRVVVNSAALNFKSPVQLALYGI